MMTRQQFDSIDSSGKIVKAIEVSGGTEMKDALIAMTAVAKYYDNSPDGAFIETMKEFAYWLLYHRTGVVGEDASEALFDLWLSLETFR